MPDEIKPALTPEEWKEVERSGGAIQYDGVFDTLDLAPATERAERLAYLMALANAALPDDDPRKITREDVLKLCGSAALHEMDEINGRYTDPAPITEYITGLREIAARLAALLPPNQ